jgi:hypothetical protein
MTGPVQVLVVGFDQPSFSGELMAELDRLGQAGTIRLLDVLLVARWDDGSFDSLPFPEGAAPGLGRLAAEILGGADADGVGPTAAEDADADAVGAAWSLADAVPIGSSAAVALIEHLWAIPLRAAVHRSGGRALDETWLAPADVERLERLRARPMG